MEKDLSERENFNISFEEMRLTQKLFFLGFPYGMYTKDSKNVNNLFPIPFVKKGILSAFDNDVISGSVGYLDGHTNPGFSGGPIIYIHIKTGKIYVAGVMHGYVIHGGKIDYEEINDDGEMTLEQFDYEENSGIVKFYNIKHVKEIID